MKAKQTPKPRQLTAKQAKFALLMARGYTKSAAYREAYNAVRMNAHAVAEEARRLCENPLISRTINEHLEASAIEDITNTRRILRGMLDDLEKAREDGNHTAVAALNKTLAQVYGMTSTKLVLSDEKSQTDEQLAANAAKIGGLGDRALERRIFRNTLMQIGNDSFEPRPEMSDAQIDKLLGYGSEDSFEPDGEKD